MKKNLLMIWLILASLLAAAAQLSTAAANSPAQSAQDGQALFQQKCAACHTIGGGKLVGPDLQGVVQLRDPSWLRNFIATPGDMIASGDPLARQLWAENNQVMMPDLGLAENEVAALIAYLENPASAEAAAGGAPAGPPAALPAGNPEAGRRLFTGETRLSAAGPACLACHSVEGIGALGGGSLGPELTHVLQRYGTAGLAANLNQITFPTMLGPFLNKPLSPQEQADLLAYFTATDALTAAPTTNVMLTRFVAIGAGVALLLFAGMLAFRPRPARTAAERVRRGRRGAQSV